jgi:alkylation response protein AidB-like acyl-CoA dehydrogenase
MNFDVSEQQAKIIKVAREFGENEIAPKADEYNQEGRFPLEIYRNLGRAGLLGITIPTEWGGAGMDHVTLMKVVEELGYHCLVLSAVVGMNSCLTGLQLLHYGSDEQKEKYLRPLVRGDVLISIAVTEPQGGSNVRAATTKATPNSKGYAINGVKRWISWGRSSDAVLVLARLGDADQDPRFTTFIVDKGTPGLTITSMPNMLTRQLDEVSEVVFDNCQVSEACRIGEEGGGLRVALSGLEGNRGAFAARTCGGIKACLDESVKFARERIVGGTPIGKNQMIQNMIADMATNLEAAKYLTYHLAWLKDTGVLRARKESSMAKLFSTDAFMKAATDAVQIHGAQGCVENSVVARLFRDAKAHQIMEGTSEIQRVLIAESALGYSP